MSILGNPIIVGVNQNLLEPIFSYSVGQSGYAYDYEISNGVCNWELAFLAGNHATLNFSRVTNAIDIFIVGGGNNGLPGYSANTDYHFCYGGKGGNGGEIKTIRNVAVSPNVDYYITIGGAGNEEQEETHSVAYTTTTSITIGNTTYSCISGNGLTGGTKGIVYYNQVTQGGDGRTGEYAFEDSNTLLWGGYHYGSSGGGAGCRNDNGYIAGYGIGGLCKIYPNSIEVRAGRGGNYNGDGTSAPTNSGAGGGGGGYDQYNTTDYGYGFGGSGIIIIRNHRS